MELTQTSQEIRRAIREMALLNRRQRRQEASQSNEQYITADKIVELQTKVNDLETLKAFLQLKGE